MIKRIGILTLLIVVVGLIFGFVHITPAQKPQKQLPPQQVPRININTASLNELISLPGVGQVIAQRIIEYRDKHGPFRRPQDIIIIKGMSEKKYHKIANSIRVD